MISLPIDDHRCLQESSLEKATEGPRMDKFWLQSFPIAVVWLLWLLCG